MKYIYSLCTLLMSICSTSIIGMQDNASNDVTKKLQGLSLTLPSQVTLSASLLEIQSPRAQSQGPTPVIEHGGEVKIDTLSDLPQAKRKISPRLGGHRRTKTREQLSELEEKGKDGLAKEMLKSIDLDDHDEIATILHDTLTSEGVADKLAHVRRARTLTNLNAATSPHKKTDPQGEK
jgi:hypothetical protein